MDPVLTIDNLTYLYPEGSRPALHDVSLSLASGECVCLTGPSGCGKTTLLLAIQGLLKGSGLQGKITVAPSSSCLDVGMVFQNAETQIICTTVEDEASFGLSNFDLAPGAISRAIKEALDAVGLAGFEKRNVEELSAGEKQRLTIASLLSLGPGLLLLDEPTSQLDADGKKKLIELLAALKIQGHSLLIVDHDLFPFRSLGDRFVFMKDGGIVNILNKPPIETRPSEPVANAEPAPLPDEKASHAVVVRNLQVARNGAPSVFDGLDLAVSDAELLHIYGRNGAGKSTLLRCLCGLVKVRSGHVEIVGIQSPRPEKLLGKAGLLFQNPQRQLFEDTVFDEVGFSLKRLGLPPHEIQDRVSESLTLCDAGDLADRPPLTLSFGEQHRVALASVLAPRPRVLLLDEPFAGLDMGQRFRLLRILEEVRDRFGSTVIIASHDPILDPHWADRVLIIENGRLSQGSQPERIQERHARMPI